MTLPGARYGLISAAFVVFTLVITDFGIAKVIGGQFNVLATDAYKQVIGQQNFEMGAVVGMVLLVPAVLAFVVDRMVQRRQVALLSARAVPLEPKPKRARATLRFTVYCLVVGGLIARRARHGGLGARSSPTGPTISSLTLEELRLRRLRARRLAALLHLAADGGAGGGVRHGDRLHRRLLIEKSQGFRAGARIAQLLAMLPMAVPGLVLGLGYMFFFNAKWNPLSFLYGTMPMLVINSVAHFYTVGAHHRDRRR